MNIKEKSTNAIVVNKKKVMPKKKRIYPKKKSSEIVSSQKTAGYDCVLVINKKLINEASAALFYSNFLTFNKEIDFRTGDKALPTEFLEKVPAKLKKFLYVRYRFKLLHEPFIQFTLDKKMTLSAHLRLYVWMMDGLELKFDADLVLETPLDATIKNDQDGNQKLLLDLKSSKFNEFTIKIKESESNVVNADLKNLFTTALDRYFKESVTPIEITLPSFSIYLPYTEKIDANKFNIELAEIMVYDTQQIIVACNFLGKKGGNKNLLKPFAPNSNVAFAISEDAMLRTYNFFWDHTNWGKSVRVKGTFEINALTKIFDVAFDVGSFILNAATKIVSLGFLESELDFEKLEFSYDVFGELKSKPTFELLPGNQVRVENIATGLVIRLKAELSYRVKAYLDTSGPIPDKLTPWDDDVLIYDKNKKKELFCVNIRLEQLSIKRCTGELILDTIENALKVKILNLVLGNIFTTDCPVLKLGDKIITYVTNKLGEYVIPKIPPICVSPSIMNLEIPGVEWPLTISGRKLEIKEDEAIVGAYMSFDKMKTITEPMPKYVGNWNNMEVHRIGCDCILDTYETHQKGFYALQTALSQGYDGCKKCLPAYHKR